MTDPVAPAVFDPARIRSIRDPEELEAEVNRRVRVALELTDSDPPSLDDPHPVYTVVPGSGIAVRVHVVPHFGRAVVSIRSTVANELTATPGLFEAVARWADSFTFAHPFVEVTHDGVNLRVGHRLFESFDEWQLQLAISSVADAVVSIRKSLGLEEAKAEQPVAATEPTKEPEPERVGGYL